MKKINCVLVGLVFFTLVVNATALAGSANRKGDGEILTSEEEAGLLFMREEEKLARDVYRVLYEKWELGVFDNIAQSEQRHMDAVLYLIGKYNLADPALDPGIFQNEELQALYDDLVDKGLKSIVDAIEVGVIIEETDIADIVALLDQTDKNDIIRVYTNLLDGSHNHLDAFNSHL